MKLYPRAEANVTSSDTSGCTWHAPRVRVGKSCNRHEIILTFDCDRVSTTMARLGRMIIAWCARSTGPGAVIEMREWREDESRGFGVDGLLHRG